MKLLHKLAFVTAGIALSFGMVKANPAQAADLAYDFTVQTSSGTYNGFFSFNPLLSGFTDFSFDFKDVFGAKKTYTLSDLTSEPAKTPIPTGTPPSAPGGIYGFFEFGSKPVFLGGGFSEFFTGFVDNSGENSFVVEVNTPSGKLGIVESGTFTSVQPRSVPEPNNSTIEALAILGLGGVLLKKKLASKKQQLKVVPLELN